MSVLSEELVGFREKSHIRFPRQQSEWRSRMLMSCDFGQTLWRSCHAPSLHYTLTFALIVEKKPGKPPVRVEEKCLAEQRWARFVMPTCPPF